MQTVNRENKENRLDFEPTSDRSYLSFAAICQIFERLIANLLRSYTFTTIKVYEINMHFYFEPCFMWIIWTLMIEFVWFIHPWANEITLKYIDKIDQNLTKSTKKCARTYFLGCSVPFFYKTLFHISHTFIHILTMHYSKSSWAHRTFRNNYTLSGQNFSHILK